MRNSTGLILTWFLASTSTLGLGCSKTEIGIPTFNLADLDSKPPFHVQEDGEFVFYIENDLNQPLRVDFSSSSNLVVLKSAGHFRVEADERFKVSGKLQRGSEGTLEIRTDHPGSFSHVIEITRENASDSEKKVSGTEKVD
ncbi:MAG: hypothetical protein KDB00_26100 [Planctomycetales bacterium]|nr:hypothetical protein [Planctomycetales bacterium]